MTEEERQYLMKVNAMPPGSIKSVKHAATTEISNHLMGVMAIRNNANVEDIDSLRSAFYEYVSLCYSNGMKLSNMAAYTAIGITKTTATAWRSGKLRSGNIEYRQLIDEIDSICATYREQMMAEGQLNPVVGIWQQKQYDGMTDSPAVVQIAENPLGDKRSAAEIQDKYKDLIED